jgi:5-methylcytosine-specific restriction endonuclease McrA
MAWKGVWQAKTLIETKNARRMLLEGNVIENVWPSAQVGFALLLKSENQNCSAPWSQSVDLTVRYNRIRNVANGFNLAANPGSCRGIDAARLTITDNVTEPFAFQDGSNGIPIQLLGAVQDALLGHNTFQSAGLSAIAFDGAPTVRAAVHSSVLPSGMYGAKGTDYGVGNSSIAHYLPGALFANNALVGADCSLYPATTLCTLPRRAARLRRPRDRRRYRRGERRDAERGRRAVIPQLVLAVLLLIAPQDGRRDRGAPLMRLTPGATLTRRRAIVCARGYASRIRSVSAHRKDSVFARYGVPAAERRGYVIDHLIPLELGGSNAITNLFPQDTASARVKDRVETWAKREACTGRQSVRALQSKMRRDWRALIPSTAANSRPEGPDAMREVTELQQAISDYATLAMEYHTMTAQNYSRCDLTTREEIERLGMEQHRLHVRLYEARQRLREHIL